MVDLSSKAFLKNCDLRLKVFSYLNGRELYLKIALLDKCTRVSLPETGMLDQTKLLYMWQIPEYPNHLGYALSLSDII